MPYRIGGMNYPKPETDRYFMLLKYVEAYYDKSITKHTGSDPKHLEGHWVILDKNGVEKVELLWCRHMYYLGGIIYSTEGKVYNIETKEYYGDSYNSISSENYLFLSDKYNDDKSKRGILKININDGTTELFQ